MQLPDGTVKKGMFENNTFIEEITEEDENLESSIYENDPRSALPPGMMIDSRFAQGKKGRKKKKIKKSKLKLPDLDTHLGPSDQSGKHYASSAKKVMLRNFSEPSIRRPSQLNMLSARKKKGSKERIENTKNTLSFPKINSSTAPDSAISDRLQGYTGIAKNQAAERKKLETYFKSLDKAVQILRQKRQNDLASRPWVPAGPIHTIQYRPSSKHF